MQHCSRVLCWISIRIPVILNGWNRIYFLIVRTIPILPVRALEKSQGRRQTAQIISYHKIFSSFLPIAEQPLELHTPINRGEGTFSWGGGLSAAPLPANKYIENIL